MKEEESNALQMILAACELLGWKMLVPDGEHVNGIVLGTELFIQAADIKGDVWQSGISYTDAH